MSEFQGNKINLMQKLTSHWPVLAVALVTAVLITTGVIKLSAHPADRGIDGGGFGFNPYHVGYCINGEPCNPAVEDTCDHISGPDKRCLPRFGFCADSSGFCSLVTFCDDNGNRFMDGTEQICDINDPTACATCSTGCGSGVDCMGFCSLTGSVCDTNDSLACRNGLDGACRYESVHADLDNCPAGPNSRGCFDEFGIKVSCANPEQLDTDLDYKGNLCDECTDTGAGGTIVLDSFEDWSGKGFCTNGIPGECNDNFDCADTCTIADLQGNNYCSKSGSLCTSDADCPLGVGVCTSDKFAPHASEINNVVACSNTLTGPGAGNNCQINPFSCDEGLYCEYNGHQVGSTVIEPSTCLVEEWCNDEGGLTLHRRVSPTPYVWVARSYYDNNFKVDPDDHGGPDAITRISILDPDGTRAAESSLICNQASGMWGKSCKDILTGNADPSLCGTELGAACEIAKICDEGSILPGVKCTDETALQDCGPAGVCVDINVSTEGPPLKVFRLRRGNNPSRISVDLENELVWVANRSSVNAAITLLHEEEGIRLECPGPSGARGIAIDNNGRAYITGYTNNDGRIFTIDKNAAACPIPSGTYPQPFGSYGSAVDSQEIMWSADLRRGYIYKIRMSDLALLNEIDVNGVCTPNQGTQYKWGGPYGITVDQNDHVIAPCFSGLIPPGCGPDCPDDQLVANSPDVIVKIIPDRDYTQNNDIAIPIQVNSVQYVGNDPTINPSGRCQYNTFAFCQSDADCAAQGGGICQKTGVLGQGRGVAVDLNNNVWFADSNGYVHKLTYDPSALGDYTNDYPFQQMFTSRVTPIGVAVDSFNNVWAVNLFGSDPSIVQPFEVIDLRPKIPPELNDPSAVQPGGVTKFDNDGNVIHTYEIGGGAYTYSDMAGLQRGMRVRTGSWSTIFDSGVAGTAWTDLSYTKMIYAAGQQDVIIRVKADDDPIVLDQKNWQSENISGDSGRTKINFDLQGRFMRVEIVLRSRQRDSSPVILNMSINYGRCARQQENICDNGVDDDGDGLIDCDDFDCPACPLPIFFPPDNTPRPFCGDGELGDGEECDLGNQNGLLGSACSNDCQDVICGDGITVTPNEQCDDGNTDNDDGCSNACLLASSFCPVGTIDSLVHTFNLDPGNGSHTIPENALNSTGPSGPNPQDVVNDPSIISTFYDAVQGVYAFVLGDTAWHRWDNSFPGDQGWENSGGVVYEDSGTKTANLGFGTYYPDGGSAAAAQRGKFWRFNHDGGRIYAYLTDEAGFLNDNSGGIQPHELHFCRQPICGDDIIDSIIGEECEISDASACSVGQKCEACACVTACGDGVPDPGEACDAGAANTDTPCVPGYGTTCTYCNTSCQEIEVIGEHCGDGQVNGTEFCDPGPLDPSCNPASTTCVPGFGAQCDNDCTQSICGDNLFNPNNQVSGHPADRPNEECDGTDSPNCPGQCGVAPNCLCPTAP